MTPREPDRFEAKAREITQAWGPQTTLGDSRHDVAAALRAEHASALERAAHDLRGVANSWRIYEHATAEQGFEVAIRELLTQARALIPSAAAPAAVTIHPPTSCAPSATIPSPSTATLEDAGISQPTMYAAPAGETGKARCPFDEQDCLDARQLLRECEDFVRWMIRAEGSKWNEARSNALLAKLAARAAPSEGEGK